MLRKRDPVPIDCHPCETAKRSWVKSITWRILGIIILGGLSWLFLHDWRETGLVTISFNLIRFFLYYCHERAWEKVKWGRKKPVVEDYAI
jgi:uncharacterized membrane protein